MPLERPEWLMMPLPLGSLLNSFAVCLVGLSDFSEASQVCLLGHNTIRGALSVFLTPLGLPFVLRKLSFPSVE